MNNGFNEEQFYIPITRSQLKEMIDEAVSTALETRLKATQADDGWCNTEEACKRLGISRQTLSNWFKRPELRLEAYRKKIHGVWAYDVEHLRQMDLRKRAPKQSDSEVYKITRTRSRNKNE